MGEVEVDVLERNQTALWIEFYDLVDTVQASYSRNDGENPLDGAPPAICCCWTTWAMPAATTG